VVEVASMTNADGAAIDVAPGVGHTVRVPLAADLQGAMITRLF